MDCLKRCLSPVMATGDLKLTMTVVRWKKKISLESRMASREK